MAIIKWPSSPPRLLIVPQCGNKLARRARAILNAAQTALEIGQTRQQRAQSGDPAAVTAGVTLTAVTARYAAGTAAVSIVLRR